MSNYLRILRKTNGLFVWVLQIRRKGCICEVLVNLNMALGFEGYSYTTALGRKRVALVHNVEVLSPLKRTRSEKITFDSERSPLEALPLEILVSVANFSFVFFFFVPNFSCLILQ